MFNINEINKEITKKGRLINAPENLLWIRTSPSSDGAPYIEINDKKAFYTASDRGVEMFRKEANNLDDLLFYIFESITLKMAIDFELKNRENKKDNLSIIPLKQAELLIKIEPDWKEKLIKKENLIQKKKELKTPIKKEKKKKTYWESFLKIDQSD